MKIIYNIISKNWPNSRQFMNRCLPAVSMNHWVYCKFNKIIFLLFFLYRGFCLFFCSPTFLCDYFLCTEHTGLICIPFVFSVSYIFHCFSLMQILIHLVFILVFFLSSAVKEHCQLNIQFEIAQLQTKGIFSKHICLQGRQGLNTWK